MPQKRFYCLCSPGEEFCFTETVSWKLFSFCQFTGTPIFFNSTLQLLILIWISWASRPYTGRKEGKSWDTKSCLKSSNLSYSLGKIQGWVLVHAESLGACFWISLRLQAWVEATTFAFSLSCQSEMHNSAVRHPSFCFFLKYISFHIRMNSIFKTQNLYRTLLFHFSPFILQENWNFLMKTGLPIYFYLIILSYNLTGLRKLCSNTSPHTTAKPA